MPRSADSRSALALVDPRHPAVPQLSYTAVTTLRRCPELFRARFLDGLSEPVTAPAEAGTAFHEVSATTGWSNDAERLHAALVRKAAILEEPVAADLRELVRRHVERGGWLELPTDAEDVEYEVRMGATPDGEPCDRDDPEAWVGGTADRLYVENGGDQIVVDDLKTGRVRHAPDDQLRIYGWLAALRYPLASTVVGRLHWIRFGQVDVAEHSTDELLHDVPEMLRAVRDEIERRIAEDDWEPRLSDACRTCRHRESCPAFDGEVEPVSAIDSPEAALVEARRLVVLRGQVDDAEARLRAWTAEHGPVEVAAGEAFGWEPRTHESIEHVLGAAATLKARGVTDEQIWSHVSLPKAGLSRLVTAAIAGVPRGEKRDERERVLQQLRDAGALVAETRTEFRLVKAGVEEAEDA